MFTAQLWRRGSSLNLLEDGHDSSIRTLRSGLAFRKPACCRASRRAPDLRSDLPVSNNTSPKVITCPRSVGLALKASSALSCWVRTSNCTRVRSTSMFVGPSTRLPSAMACSAKAISCVAIYANCATPAALRSELDSASAFLRASKAYLVSIGARVLDCGLFCSGKLLARRDQLRVIRGCSAARRQYQYNGRNHGEPQVSTHG